MQHHQPPPFANCSVLAKVARDPARLLSVRQYWAEFNEPVEFLDDPERTFREDTADLLRVCLRHAVPYSLSDCGTLAFPVWLLREFYPVNP